MKRKKDEVIRDWCIVLLFKRKKPISIYKQTSEKVILGIISLLEYDYNLSLEYGLLEEIDIPRFRYSEVKIYYGMDTQLSNVTTKKLRDDGGIANDDAMKKIYMHATQNQVDINLLHELYGDYCLLKESVKLSYLD